MENPDQLLDALVMRIFGGKEQLKGYRLVAAGNLNQAIFLETDSHHYFLKTNHQEHADLFQKEAEGLELIKKNCGLDVPAPLALGSFEDIHYLLMEWIASSGPAATYWAQLGEGLAELHMCSWNKFGFSTENYISVLPQNNTPEENWKDFFILHRLEPMLQKAFYDGLISEQYVGDFRAIYPKLEGFFPNEKPSLLHGDLWSGNVMVTRKGQPALVDPAVYFGHREMDLAFSRLFGGFEPDFFTAYQEVFPLEPGFEERVAIYNLYPLLVHLNLFGTSYLAGITRTVKKLMG